MPPNARFVARVGVCCGFANRIRCFSVFEKEANTVEVYTPEYTSEEEGGQSLLS